MNELDKIIKSAMQDFKNIKKYIRKRDVDLFLRIRNMKKRDIDFLEEICLIHIKNIQQGDKIQQNFYQMLDSFVFSSLLQRHFFSSFELFRILCYRFHLLPKRLFMREVKQYSRKIICDNLSKLTFYKIENAVNFFAPLPLNEEQSEDYLKECLNILSHSRVDTIVINPLNLVPKAHLCSHNVLQKTLISNLRVLFENSNGKTIFLENGYEFFDLLLESLKNCLMDIPRTIKVGVSLQIYYLDSIQGLDKLAVLSSQLLANDKEKLLVRFKDIDFEYQKEYFTNLQKYKANKVFANHANSRANLIAVLDRYREYKRVLDASLRSFDIFIISLLCMWGMDSKISLEIEPELNFAFYRLARQKNINLISIQCYTKHFTQMLAYRLKYAHSEFLQGICSYIDMHINKQEWQKKCNDFSHSFNIAQKIISKRSTLSSNYQSILEYPKDTMSNLSLAVDSKIVSMRQYNFETFNYELQKPLKLDLNNDLSFANKLESLPCDTPNRNKLDDIIYLNADDMNRLTLQSISTPIVFSLNTQKEKDALAKAISKKEEIESNKISIMTNIISLLKDKASALFATLCQIYPDMPKDIIEEKVYLLIDTFKYYGYEYRNLTNETDSVLLTPVGNVLVYTNSLDINEIASCVAANIMIGNVSFVEDCLQARILYYLLMPILDFCPFMSLYRNSQIQMQAQILCHGDKYTESTNSFISDRGVAVVFISSFYDIYEAFCEIMKSSIANPIPMLIYTDSYIYDDAQKIFVPLNVSCSSLGDLIANLPKKTSHVSIFTYNKTEMNYAILHINTSICINGSYKLAVVSGSARIFRAGYLQPFLSRYLLHNLVSANPSNVIKKNSLYSDVIGCFGGILGVDEIEFLYNLNHNYSQYLKNLERTASVDNLYEVKKNYKMVLRVYNEDDFFHICVIMLVAHLLQIPTKISFSPTYLSKNESAKSLDIDKLSNSFLEKYISIFTLVIEEEQDFLNALEDKSLLRILQDEDIFLSKNTNTYRELKTSGIIAEYSLPILNKNLELERYVYTQYIQIKPNIFLQTQTGYKIESWLHNLTLEQQSQR